MSIEYKNSNIINLDQNKININIAGRDVRRVKSGKRPPQILNVYNSMNNCDRIVLL